MSDNWIQELEHDSTCFSCNETYDERPYEHICGECFHRWETDKDLIDHYNTHGGLKSSVDEIHSCPCCAHDF